MAHSIRPNARLIWSRVLRAALPALLLAALSGPAWAAQAAPTGAPEFTVNSLLDVPANPADTNQSVCRTDVGNSTCTLRAAIMKANQFGPGVVIHLPAGVHRLTVAKSGTTDANGDLDILQSMSLLGTGAAGAIVDGGGLDRVFTIAASVVVQISDVTIRGGAIGAGDGGGLFNSGTLTLTRVLITGNSGYDGAGLANNGSLTVNDSTFEDNRATFEGGGLYQEPAGKKLNINRSTFHANRADNSGGAISNQGNYDPLLLTDSTLSANSTRGPGGAIVSLQGVTKLFNVTLTGNLANSQREGGGPGGGIAFDLVTTGSFEIWNSLLAENHAGIGPDECKSNTGFISHGHNYLQVLGTCAITTTGNLFGGDPLLGPLAANGGPTLTRGLFPGSPVLDQEPTGECRDAAGTAPAPDQRGVTRPINGACDLGAFEGTLNGSLYGRNLVRNGDAEDGAGSPSGAWVGVPIWQVSSGEFTAVPYNAAGGYPTSTVPGPNGFTFFSGGQGGVSTGVQTITVATIGGPIDGSGVRFSLAGDLGGYAEQADSATLSATFLNQAGSAIGSPTVIGPVTHQDRQDKTALLHRAVAGQLPVGTRAIRVTISMTLLSGSFNDGYADNLALVLQPALKLLYLPLVLR